MPVKEGKVALTQLVKKAGCDSKIGQADLQRILSKLPSVNDPNVIVGMTAGDDAGIYRLNDQLSLVQTVDVFTPNVDDPYLFGQIAAANSVSDIYAMGGKPLTALSIIGFPIETLDGKIMEEILRGGIDKLAEAGCVVIGGHSINDEEIKFGFAVTGLIDENKAIIRGNAKVGDSLIITKPLGTGMLSFAAQIGRINNEVQSEVGRWMAELNKDAAELMVEMKANACTDITGFGLMGHLVEMVRSSGVNAEIDISKLPVFGAVEYCIENEILSGAIERNQEYSSAWLEVKDDSYEKNLPILFDPQTSGGLLISIPTDRAENYIKEMHSRGHHATTIVGRITEKNKNISESKVIITNTKLMNFIGKREGIIMEKEDQPCCANPPSFENESNDDYKAKFTEFMKSVNKEGAVDKKTKKLLAIALSISQKCEPCLKIHIKSALEMGITKEQIDETAYVAISFSGAPAMMFYNDVCKELNL